MVLDDPILPGKPAIEKTVLDVARDFLRAQKTDRQLGIIDTRFVAARRAADVEAGFGKKRECRLLQTARGQSDAENFVVHRKTERVLLKRDAARREKKLRRREQAVTFFPRSAPRTH